MAKLKNWCVASDEKIKAHTMRVLQADATKIAQGIKEIAADVPAHYASGERVARLLRTLDKKGAAAYLKAKLPTEKKIRSGDLGEILGASYISEFTGYATGVHRLRWKDHREMAMRGDDLLAIRADPKLKVKFLKGEVKSSASLSSATVSKARAALASNRGRPSPHALSFIADRLHETGNDALGDLIDESLLKNGIKLKQVTHLMFTFSGNDPRNMLRNDLQGYSGTVRQLSVGMYVPKHQEFIKAVYAKVTANGI
jgi:hypothetical protein